MEIEIEFIGRWPRQRVISKEQRQVNRILNKEEDEESEVEFIYRPLVINIAEPMTYNKYDDEHTVVRTGKDIFILQCGFEHFKHLREFLLGKVIRRFDDFVMEKVPEIASLEDILRSPFINGEAKAEDGFKFDD